MEEKEEGQEADQTPHLGPRVKITGAEHPFPHVFIPHKEAILVLVFLYLR
jgi:hypothetical protein